MLNTLCVVFRLRRTLAVLILAAIIAPPPLIADDPVQSANELAAGRVLAEKWEYSTDGGKTFGPEAPKISGSHTVPTRADVARTKFTIDDPAQIGLLKIAFTSGRGALALTNAASVDRYNVGACPTLMSTKITLNGEATDL